MDKQELFDFLKENLRLDVDRLYTPDDEGASFEICLHLTNPATGKDEVVARNGFSV